MLNVGPGEVLLILVIALVVLGPSRLPGTARAMGRILARTRRIVTKFQQEMQAAADAPLEAIARERGRLDPTVPAAAPGAPGEPAASGDEPGETPPTASPSRPEHRDAR